MAQLAAAEGLGSVAQGLHGLDDPLGDDEDRSAGQENDQGLGQDQPEAKLARYLVRAALRFQQFRLGEDLHFLVEYLVKLAPELGEGPHVRADRLLDRQDIVDDFEDPLEAGVQIGMPVGGRRFGQVANHLGEPPSGFQRSSLQLLGGFHGGRFELERQPEGKAGKFAPDPRNEPHGAGLVAFDDPIRLPLEGPVELQDSLGQAFQRCNLTVLAFDQARAQRLEGRIGLGSPSAELSSFGPRCGRVENPVEGFELFLIFAEARHEGCIGRMEIGQHPHAAADRIDLHLVGGRAQGFRDGRRVAEGVLELLDGQGDDHA